MKFTLLSATILACTAVASADYCSAGLTYCGDKLLSFGGWYPGYVRQALYDKGISFDQASDVLFECNGGAALGSLTVIQDCGIHKCINGQGKDDYCVA